MSLSTLPLCYCTNVHPGQTLGEVEQGIESFAVPIAVAFDAPLAIGLWFADSVRREIDSTPGAAKRLRDQLQSHRLSCHTLNAFPYGNFHSERVKEQVYLPDWSSSDRFAYTLGCAKILAELLPDGREGSISTMPLGFALAERSETFFGACVASLVELARALDELHSETGRIIRLAIEPEPFCHLQTTPETISFFARLRDAAERAGVADLVEQHLGVCYDVCHQAVEYEDAAASIAALRSADVRINKVQISCAIELLNPRENVAGRQALASYVEPRYLHQTFAWRATGDVASVPDLTHDLCENPPSAFLDAESWRIHFHVPVNETRLGPLLTTRPQLEAALAAVEQLDYAPHLEVETYTWEVLPGRDRPSIVDGIAQELRATRRLLTDLRLKPA